MFYRRSCSKALEDKDFSPPTSALSRKITYFPVCLFPPPSSGIKDMPTIRLGFAIKYTFLQHTSREKARRFGSDCIDHRRIQSPVSKLFAEFLLHAHSHGWSLLHVCKKAIALPSENLTFLHGINPRVWNCSPDYLYSFLILWRLWAHYLAEYMQVYRFWMIPLLDWINSAWLMFCTPQEFRKSDRILHPVLTYLESHLSYRNLIPLFYFVGIQEKPQPHR